MFFCIFTDCFLFSVFSFLYSVISRGRRVSMLKNTEMHCNVAGHHLSAWAMRCGGRTIGIADVLVVQWLS